MYSSELICSSRYIRIALWYDVYLCSVLGSFIVSRTH